MAPSTASAAVIVFARAPERGKVKTRLAAEIGEEAALTLHCAFVEDVCRLAREIEGTRVLQVAGDANDSFLRGIATRYRMEIRPQAEGDLGVRMERALGEWIHDDARACIVGSDAPTLPLAYLRDAFAALDRADVVLGPATDGGYYLIGARRRVPDLFSNMAWGTPSVLGRTLERLRDYRATLLPFHYDVDTANDLALVRAHLEHLARDVAPATRIALGKIP